MEKARFIVPLPAGVDLDRLLLHEARRKVYDDSTVTLDGVLYEVHSTLMGERISLRYDPALPPMRRRVVVVHDGRQWVARVVDSYANTRVRRAYNSEHLVVQDAPPPRSPPPHPGRHPLPPRACWTLTPEVKP